MAATTAASDPPAEEHPPAASEPATADVSRPNAAPSGDSARGPGPSASRPALGYNLLRPPDYDNIVGGVPPSPFVSAILLGAIALLVAAAILSATGADAAQWWELGGMLLAVAVFLAAFVSRA